MQNKCLQKTTNTTQTTNLVSNNIIQNGQTKKSDVFYQTKTNTTNQIKEVPCADFYKNFVYFNNSYDYYNDNSPIYIQASSRPYVPPPPPPTQQTTNCGKKSTKPSTDPDSIQLPIPVSSNTPKPAPVHSNRSISISPKTSQTNIDQQETLITEKKTHLAKSNIYSSHKIVKSVHSSPPPPPLKPKLPQEELKSTSLTIVDKQNTKLENLPELKLKYSNKSSEYQTLDIPDSKYGIIELSPIESKSKTPLLDAITDLIIPRMSNNTSISSSSFLTNQSQVLSPSSSNEFKTSLYVGADFAPEDISVQLVDNQAGHRVTKKLFVHCFKTEPISSKSLTINAGKLASPTKIDFDLSNATNNYIRKELKKDIFIPNNADINTLESYLENGHLVIKCLLKPNEDTTTTTTVFQNPLYNSSNSQDTANNKSILKSQATNSFCLDYDQVNRVNRRQKESLLKQKRHKSNDVNLDGKSVRFDINNERAKSKSTDRSGNRRATSSSSIINDDMIQDGFNCITRDAMDNIFLTYFFKLPSCSPSDRTQVRIENKNILKLKIIQEQNFLCKKPKKKTFKKIKSKKTNTNSTFSTTSLSSSSSCSLSLSYSKSTSLESLESESELSASNDKTKIMLREFSRQCRLPDNFFKFDEQGVTVSFVNNGWVRIEIPIVEFFDFSNCSKVLNQGGQKKKHMNEQKANKSRHSEINCIKSLARGSVSSSNDFVLLSEVRV